MAQNTPDRNSVLSSERFQDRIFLIRGYRVMLSPHLAELYGVENKVLLQAVKRNTDRFPADFMFQLVNHEFNALRSQIVTLKTGDVTSKRGQHPKYLPYAFTEQGVAMLSSVLRSPQAVKVNIEIMRTFVRLRQLLSSNDELARKLDAMEDKYDIQFKIVFDAIREMMKPPEGGKRPIGFSPWDE